MIPVKDVRKILYITASEKSLADFQAMFSGVVAAELLSEAMSGDYFYAVEFSPEVDGLTLGTASANINLSSGDAVPASEFSEGAKIPFYLVAYIRE